MADAWQKLAIILAVATARKKNPNKLRRLNSPVL